MGSGLILLVIVGAWLAVLVPMGLRSQDGAAVARSLRAERLGEAVRVLSRRRAGALGASSSRAEGEADAEPDGAVADGAVADGAIADGAVPGAATPNSASLGSPASPGAPVSPAGGAPVSEGPVPDAAQAAVPAPAVPAAVPTGGLAARLVLPRFRFPERKARPAKADPDNAGSTERRPVPLVVRRRRVMLVLLLLSGNTTLAGWYGPGYLLVIGAVLALVAVAYAAHCRRQVVARARRARRQARMAALAARAPRAPREQVEAPVAATARVRRPAPRVSRPVAPQPARTLEQLLDQLDGLAPEPSTPPGTGEAPHATGSDWTPVPVPRPLYLRGSAPSGPSAAPGSGSRRVDPPAAAPRVQPEGDAVVERQRAAGDW